MRSRNKGVQRCLNRKTSMDRAKVNAVSIALQPLAAAIEDFLTEVAGGEKQAFVLVVCVDGVSQYISNASRPDGTMLIEELLERWKTKRADIPAHYNPDLNEQQ